MPMPRRYTDLEPSWKSEYLAGLSVHAIGRRHGVYGQTVWSYLNKAGVAMRSGEDSTRKEPIRKDAFSLPLTPSDAYWLGLLFADGSMVHRRSEDDFAINLTAHKDDEESIVGFLGHFGLTGPIFRRADKLSVSTAVSSKTITARLRLFGLEPNKTHTMRYPDVIPAGMDAPFIRGYLDGDGCIHFRMRPRYVTPQGSIGFSGNSLFLGDIADRIEAHTGMKPTGSVQHKKTRLIQYEGRLRITRLASWLYADNGPRLSRKFKTLTDNIGYIACAGEIAQTIR